MTAPEVDIHIKVVEEWLRSNSQNLSASQKVMLLEKAIKGIEERASITLSGITLMVVLDRILHQAQHKFPILSVVIIEDQLLNFSKINKDKDTTETVAAYTHLLIELLKVLARITANILTTPLHNALKKVTSKDSGES